MFEEVLNESEIPSLDIIGRLESDLTEFHQSNSEPITWGQENYNKFKDEIGCKGSLGHKLVAQWGGSKVIRDKISLVSTDFQVFDISFEQVPDLPFQPIDQNSHFSYIEFLTFKPKAAYFKELSDGSTEKYGCLNFMTYDQLKRRKLLPYFSIIKEARQDGVQNYRFFNRLIPPYEEEGSEISDSEVLRIVNGILGTNSGNSDSERFFSGCKSLQNTKGQMQEFGEGLQRLIQ